MSRIQTLVLALLTVALSTWVIATPASAASCNDTWTSTSSGEWETPGDWSAGVPTSTSHVCIEKAVTVTMTDGQPGSVPVASIDLGGESGAAAQLHVSIHDVVKSEVTTIGSHATLTLDGTYHGANAGNASLGGGTVTNQGTIVMQGEGYSATLFGTVTNDGTIDVPFGTVSFGEGGNGGSGSLVNRGTIDVSPPTANPGDPAGVEDISAPLTDESGSIVNEGSFVVKGAGASYNQGNGSESGNPIHIGQATTLNYTGAGASNVEVGTGSNMTGSLAAGQKLQLDIGTVVTAPTSFTNAGTIVLNGTYYGGGGGPAEIALSSGTLTNTGTLITESNAALSGSLENKGLVSIAPNSVLEQIAGTFTNAPGGTLAPQISSREAGELQIDNETHFVAGGTLAPSLIGGFVPTKGQEFRMVNGRGGVYSGQFAAVINGFGAAYNSTVIEAIFGGGITGPTSPAPPSPSPVASIAHVLSLVGGAGAITVKLSCPAGGAACSADSVVARVTEHLKHGKLSGVSAVSKRTKVVVIASGSVSLKAGAVKQLKLTLNKTGQALLKRYGSLTAIVTVTTAGKKLKTITVHIHKAVKHKQG